MKVHPEFIAKVIDHLIRNQWINSITRKRTGLHYVLTELGREAFLENQTVASVLD